MKISFLGLLATVLATIGATSGITSIRDYVDRAHADREFDTMVTEYRVLTRDPCNPHPMRLVQPSQHSSRKAVIIFGGNTITAEQALSISFQNTEPAPGEKTVRVYLESSDTPGFRELIWLARDTKACNYGYEGAILGYAISYGSGPNKPRPSWPVSQTK
jgi:hypothetical protein